MASFEIVERFEGADLALPIRKTQGAAGYDFAVAEDTLLPAFNDQYKSLRSWFEKSKLPYATLSQISEVTKISGIKPTLVPTGIKAKLDPGTYLELSVRSSCPLKYWIILANGKGIIDSDYYGNASNDGEIFFQLINLSPYPILLQKGDIIGQGIILPYLTTDNDAATGKRTGGFGSTSV